MCQFCSVGPSNQHGGDSTDLRFAGFFSADAIEAAIRQANRNRNHRGETNINNNNDSNSVVNNNNNDDDDNGGSSVSRSRSGDDDDDGGGGGGEVEDDGT